jgi:ribonuclease PH
VQGTAEEQAFTKDELFAMMGLAETGCQVLFQEQQKQIGDFFPIP